MADEPHLVGPGRLAWRPARPDDPALGAPVAAGLAGLNRLAQLNELNELNGQNELNGPAEPSGREGLHGLNGPATPVLVADIDADAADTAEFCARYGIEMAESANCVVVAGRRGDVVRYAACLVLATTRADVNGIVRRRLEARKASFAPMADAVERSGMEFGGITPIGLPADWTILVDAAVVAAGTVVIGSGLRRSKLALDGATLLALPNAELVDGLAG